MCEFLGGRNVWLKKPSSSSSCESLALPRRCSLLPSTVLVTPESKSHSLEVPALNSSHRNNHCNVPLSLKTLKSSPNQFLSRSPRKEGTKNIWFPFYICISDGIFITGLKPSRLHGARVLVQRRGSVGYDPRTAATTSTGPSVAASPTQQEQTQTKPEKINPPTFSLWSIAKQILGVDA